MAVLRSGKEVELVIEISLDAGGDPTYNCNDLLADTGWCTLGRDGEAGRRCPSNR